jgi:hypothetical protein
MGVREGRRRIPFQRISLVVGVFDPWRGGRHLTNAGAVPRVPMNNRSPEMQHPSVVRREPVSHASDRSAEGPVPMRQFRRDFLGGKNLWMVNSLVGKE